MHAANINILLNFVALLHLIQHHTAALNVIRSLTGNLHFMHTSRDMRKIKKPYSPVKNVG